VIAGRLAGSIGLVPSVFGYTLMTVLLGLIGLRAQARLKRSSRGCACRRPGDRAAGAAVHDGEAAVPPH
jgi:hypothetical protein